MRYRSGEEVRVGDVVSIDGRHSGIVVWCAGSPASNPAPGAEDWSYLGAGAMIITSFAGPVHYSSDAELADDDVDLVRRS